MTKIIRQLWRRLSPGERQAIAKLGELAGLLVSSIVVRRLVALLAVPAATAATTLYVAGGPASEPAFEPMSHAGLSAEVPADAPIADDPVARAEAIAASEAAARDTTSGPDDVGDPKTLAAGEQRGCVTRSVRNRSSRNGARPALLVAHYTVSPNRPGWSDVNRIVSYFDNPRAQASSTYVIDFEGNCAYIVNEALKPWTQGFFNPWSISIEFIATGKEKVWPEPALRKGARVFADAAKRWGIPIQPAVTSGCKVVRAGITDHDALGCGNDHTDVRPHFPMAKFIAYVRAAGGPIPKPKPPARPYRVCSTKRGKTHCADAVRAGAAVELRLRRGAARVEVTRR